MYIVYSRSLKHFFKEVLSLAGCQKMVPEVGAPPLMQLLQESLFWGVAGNKGQLSKSA